MSNPRRRIIRRSPNHQPSAPNQQRQLLRLRSRLDQERAALARWQTRMRRAFNATLKHQKAITRIERQLAQLEG
jgi:hypothetical protein